LAGCASRLNIFAVLSRIVDQAEELCRFRNQLIHGLWNLLSVDDGIVEIMETRPSRKSAQIRQISQYWNIDYLEWLIAAISRCTYLLYNFGKQFDLID
jgi:hypothetical protein